MPLPPSRYLPLLLPVVLCAHGMAQAQSIDYGALERLFQEPVTTSATGSPQRVTDVPASMVIVTAEDIRKYGYRTLAEALELIQRALRLSPHDPRRFMWLQALAAIREREGYMAELREDEAGFLLLEIYEVERFIVQDDLDDRRLALDLCQ